MLLTILSNIWSNGFDNSIAIWASELFNNMPSVFKSIVISISSFGDYGIFYICLAILFLCFKKTRKLAVYLIVGLLLALIFNDMIFKNIFDRARPFQDPDLVTQLASVRYLEDGSYVLYGIQPSSSSFPSGHTFIAFTVATLVTTEYIFNKEERKFYLPFMVFFIVLAVLMGFTRVLLSHHYMTDVIAGMLLGVALGIGGYFLIKYTPSWYRWVKSKIDSKKNKEEVVEETTTEKE